MDHINKDFVGWFTYPRLYSDIISVMSDGDKFVEVGVYEGKSLAYFLVEMIDLERSFDVYAVDSFTFEGLLDKFNSNMSPVSDKFNTIVDLSWSAADRFEDKSVDVVFIDADHVYENVKKDIMAWLPKIKKGGIIAGHDYCDEHPGVIKAVHEIFGDNFYKEYLDELCWVAGV